MRSILLPLAIYLAVTLGVPLANGAAARREFWHHAAEILVVAALLVGLRSLVRAWPPSRPESTPG
jgi:hypothetical protein